MKMKINEFGLRLENTFATNIQLIIRDKADTPVGVLINNDESYFIGDKVRVTGDYRGYIAPGITKPGYGVIESIVRDDTDHFFRIRMDNGECGSVKSNRIVVA